MEPATIPFVNETWQLERYHVGADTDVPFVASHGPVRDSIETRLSIEPPSSQSNRFDSCHTRHSPSIGWITPHSPSVAARPRPSVSPELDAQEVCHQQKKATSTAYNAAQPPGAAIDHCLQSLTATPFYGAQDLLPDSGLGPLPDVVMGLLNPSDCGGQSFWPKEHTTLQCACLVRCFMLEIAPYVSF